MTDKDNLIEMLNNAGIKFETECNGSPESIWIDFDYGLSIEFAFVSEEEKLCEINTYSSLNYP